MLYLHYTHRIYFVKGKPPLGGERRFLLLWVLNLDPFLAFYDSGWRAGCQEGKTGAPAGVAGASHITSSRFP